MDCPDGETRHQINYTIIQKENSELIHGTQRLPGASFGSDHELLIADKTWKLKIKRKQIPAFRYNVEYISEHFSIAVENRFAEQSKLCEEKKQPVH